MFSNFQSGSEDFAESPRNAAYFETYHQKDLQSQLGIDSIQLNYLVAASDQAKKETNPSAPKW